MRTYDHVEAVLSHADPLDVRAQKLLHAQHVLLGGEGQVFEVLALGDVLIPAVHRFVLDRRFFQQLKVGRHAVQLLAVVPVRDADLDLLQARQHVQLGQVELSEAVDHVRVAHLWDVEPATATWTARGRAELGADTAQVLTHVVVQLRWERTFTDTRAVGLDDANDAVEAVWRDAATINVQHGGVGALDEDLLARHVCVVQVRDSVDREAEHVVLDATVVLDLGGHVHLQVWVVVLVELDLVAQLGLEVVEVAQVAHADAVAEHLGAVRWTDALLGGANLVAATTFLVEAVNLLVQVQHHVRAVRDEDATFIVNAHALQLVQLLQQTGQVHDDTVANDAHGVLVQNARRHQVELVLLAVVHDGVAGVGAARHARNDVVLLRQHVHELALAFIAPLGAQHHVHAGVQPFGVALRVRHSALDAVELGHHLLEHRAGRRFLGHALALRAIVAGSERRQRQRTRAHGRPGGHARVALRLGRLSSFQGQDGAQGAAALRLRDAHLGHLPDGVEPHLFQDSPSDVEVQLGHTGAVASAQQLNGRCTHAHTGADTDMLGFGWWTRALAGAWRGGACDVWQTGRGGGVAPMSCVEVAHCMCIYLASKQASTSTLDVGAQTQTRCRWLGVVSPCRLLSRERESAHERRTRNGRR
ncbi:TPA: hypothetical protein N0F65_007024 [Lagenidium giganteum]|uniref:Uncharacterized protein n=1 Tax=Lagenidium giganteum TaxID=4803 RepID=A0AAV2YUE3_9STRA|nr:TPA: hypothetical protein N0F65_007024 [Lagenidium giganteum]